MVVALRERRSPRKSARMAAPRHFVDGRMRHLRRTAWPCVMISLQEPTEAPSRILTVEGWLSLEEDYLPRVCSGELRDAPPEAQAALVIAARTYVLRAMRDDPRLGRSRPIPNGEGFQVFAGHATAACTVAATRTRGLVVRHNGRMILANYVAGAPWMNDGTLGRDVTNTERWVTYNAGRSGAVVIPTRLSLATHPGNRGCMSQNGAHYLAARGYGYQTILRYFYGDDIELFKLKTEGNGRLVGVLALAALGLLIIEGERN
ncbi:SpoIID/LytB domain-containing protein [Polyangium aurulentum]|uniref:SpoIID/LytB domain-containing protein n=1 Tax=Polyangium aurulentum TaxID=2567896 RepID=UPI00200F20C7|nr:SpoIID/LytB domain-containing protein [Polyangium aurulentum]UQA60440.1 hypothetical protein E8A73_008195 [Polyangium aurulentum]